MEPKLENSGDFILRRWRIMLKKDSELPLDTDNKLKDRWQQKNG